MPCMCHVNYYTGSPIAGVEVRQKDTLSYVAGVEVRQKSAVPLIGGPDLHQLFMHVFHVHKSMQDHINNLLTTSTNINFSSS